MEKGTAEKLAGIALLAVSILLTLILIFWELQGWIETIAQLALIAVGSLATIGLKLLFFSNKSTLERNVQFYWTDVDLIKSAITDGIRRIPDLSYLNIHYSRKTDTPDNPHTPYYIVNSKTKKAYWVRPELRVLAKRGIIEGNTHDGMSALTSYLKTNDVELIPRYSQKGELQ